MESDSVLESLSQHPNNSQQLVADGLSAMGAANVTPEMIDQIMSRYHLSFTSRLASIPNAIDSKVAADEGTLSDLTDANNIWHFPPHQYSHTNNIESSQYQANESSIPPSATQATVPPMYASQFLAKSTPPRNAVVAMESPGSSLEDVPAPPQPNFHSGLPHVQDAAAASFPTMDMASGPSQLRLQSQALTAHKQCADAEQGAAHETTLQDAFSVSYAFCCLIIDKVSQTKSHLSTCVFLY